MRCRGKSGAASVHGPPEIVMTPDAIWFERCGLNDPRLDSKEHCSTAISNSFLQRFERGTLLGWLRPLCRKSASSGLPARKHSAQMRSGGEDVIRYWREITSGSVLMK
jgi:hypothetical protein